MIATLILSCLVFFYVAFRLYARRIASIYHLDDHTATPATLLNDGMDYAPTNKWYLLAQHFSAISAAGPIFGPIIAGLYFGWLPALLWIVFGCVFIGAVHDFSTLIGSVKHKARSIAELVQEYTGGKAYLVFVAYIWICLVYVLTAFSDVTARAFVNDLPITGANGETLGTVLGGGTATSSLLYLATALILGSLLKILEKSVRSEKLRNVYEKLLIVAGIVLVGFAISMGQKYPVTLAPLAKIFSWNNAPLAWHNGASTWLFLILAYCGVASLLPVWLLLQPRGFLGGTFLYVILIAGLGGLVVGSFGGTLPIQATAFVGFTSEKLGPLFPILFITIACGACSGFHGIVCSGTTSKQIRSECDTPLVGYGGMLLEGIIALIALATVMVLTPDSAKGSPDAIFATGLGRFLSVFGIDQSFAIGFAMLAFATFVFDTIDVATRLGRYLLQELTGWRGLGGSFLATLLTLALPALMLSSTVNGPDGKPLPSYLAVWPVFGASNQLLAALSLLGLYAWVQRLTTSPWARLAVGAPMVFMTIMTLWALTLNLFKWIDAINLGTRTWLDPIGLLSALLVALALTMLGMTLMPKISLARTNC